MKFSLFIGIISLGFVVSCQAGGGGSNTGDAIIHQNKTWCTVRSGVSDVALQVYIIRTCPLVDCTPIQPGGSCFDPNTLQNHASYVINLIFRRTGTCDSHIGIPSVNDPSFGSCQFS